jgi:predicted nucleic acid-binding Zn ribbon protein
VIPVQQLVPDALAALLRQAPLSEEKVAFAWRAAVGPAIAATTSIALHDGVLHVRAKDAAWQRELERSARLVRARLDALLGAGVVRRIDVAAR